jgi:hypothetical protein
MCSVLSASLPISGRSALAAGILAAVVTRSLPGAAITAGEIANPVPSTLVRVIPGEGPFPTLGAPGAAGVFVTDAAAIRVMTPAQISQRLGLPASDTFTLIQFPTPSQGLASPILRSNPGFIGGGLTTGGEPEFVIPNGPIPAGATITIVGPH